MRYLLSMLLIAGLITPASGQKDPAAKEILDRVAEKAMQGSPLQFDFSYHLESIEDASLNITQSGKAVLKGDKYRIELPSTHIFFDGVSLYNYIPDVKELTISFPDEGYDEFFLNKPSKIFTLYTEDFKYRLIQRYKKNNHSFAQIDLHPHELERSYFRIRLDVDTEANEIAEVQIFEKKGNRYTLSLSDYKILREYPDSKFTFDPATNPNVEIMDMRGL